MTEGGVQVLSYICKTHGWIVDVLQQTNKYRQNEHCDHAFHCVLKIMHVQKQRAAEM